MVLQNFWSLNWKEGDTFDDSSVLNSSEVFRLQGKEVFRAKIHKTEDLKGHGDTQFFTLAFHSYNHSQMGCKIEDVSFSIFDFGSPTGAQAWSMTQTPTNHETILQTFVDVRDYCAEFSPKFYVKMVSTVPNYGYTIADALCRDQLWTAAVEKHFTDVDFLVGNESLGAHRFLLSASSPVFAAMFKSGMGEAQTGIVRISDVDPVTFKHFLEFLYTGRVAATAKREELFVVADKYQVETLAHLCKHATEAENRNNITEAFFF